MRSSALVPGARVLVLLDCHDDTADVRFHGACGEVVGPLAEEVPDEVHSPLIEVTVDGLGRDYFFPGELQLLH